MPFLANKTRNFALDMAERYADREISPHLLASIHDQLTESLKRHSSSDWKWHAERALTAAVDNTPSEAARLAAADLLIAVCNQPPREYEQRGSRIRAIQQRTLREIFGNPFRPVAVEPSWLRWQDGTVVRIARAIYDERAFDRLPILADALEEAGCTNTDILSHCRQSGGHVRGCWVVDLLLGKE
jgi:hypothetical protein